MNTENNSTQDPIVLLLAGGERFVVPFGSIAEAQMDHKGKFESARIVETNTGKPAEVVTEFAVQAVC